MELKRHVLALDASHRKSLERIDIAMERMDTAQTAQERMEIALKRINDFLDTKQGANLNNNIVVY